MIDLTSFGRVVSLSILASCVCFATAEAAEIYTNFPPDGSCAITFYGDIEQGDENLFDILTPDCRGGGVLFKSNGGHLLAGLRIGELIRQKGLETAVSYDATCASACALAWLGGTKRYMFMDSLIGFHAAYIADGGEARESGVANALVGAYLTNLGLSVETVIFATSAKPEQMNWLNYPSAKDIGIEAVLLTDADRAWIDSLDSTALSPTN